MAKVSLRIYNREIERLVEQGQNDEAIAHCRHILKTFPKHLETYRLLGKAYLEARRYAEAVDIFGRLLMAAPDDFVAHVGLSIIRDEEGKLDDAIWHMERAYEVQSSNAAIQGELQRLYGRRDGMEPPKVRMSRGALARIYVHGELYPQAIAEIRAVLATDPQRVDMQLLLAYSYFKSGQRADATDLCTQLIKRYAYTFDANRIMVDLIPASTGAESTQVYRAHVAELDPYSNFAKGSLFQTAEVSDASINLERFEYSGEEVQMGQDWNNASLGFSSVAPLGNGLPLNEDQPDWLRSSGTDETLRTPTGLGSTPQAGEGIPDFLRDAGWGSSSGPETPSSIFDEEPGGDGLVQADIPDWLKSQTPSASPALKTEPAPSIETPDFLTNLDSSFDPFEGASTPSSGLPDWLKDASGTSTEEPAQPEPLASAAETPDWLKAAGEEPAAEGDTPDWLAGLGAAAAASTMPDGAADESSPAEPASLPDWLSPAEQPVKETSAPNIESLGASAQEQDDAVAWLESLAAKHGAKPEELVTDPNKRSETPPEWVAQAQNAGAQTPAQAPAQTPAANIESLGASAQEQDDAVAWLESLAAKHGAKPEELVTDPNKRSETPPEWVAQAQAVGKAPAESEPLPSDWSANAQNVGEEFFAQFESGSSAPADTDQTGAWINDIEGGPKAEDLPGWMKPEDEQPLVRGAIPEWLSESEPAQETSSPALNTSSLAGWLSDLGDGEDAKAKSEEELVQNQDLTEWLSGLDDEPGLDIDPAILRAPISPVAAPPVSEKTTGDLPGWLDGTSQAADEVEDEWNPAAVKDDLAPVSLSADLPDWLQGAEDEKEGDELSDLPPWSHREQWEAEGGRLAAPRPTSPADWHPVAAAASKEPDPPARERPSQRLVQNPPAPEPGSSGGRKKAPAKQGLPHGRKPEGQSAVNALNLAKSELDRGDIPEALNHYGKLIKRGKHLEEIIGHLTESLYRYPVEVGIWQTLGDAYMRANRLKEALDAYNKAEELIR
jgi:tetratricopeptide (TPR) repeat protein